MARGCRRCRLDSVWSDRWGLARCGGCGGRLERLGVKWCMEISDIGVELLVKKCRGIKVLDVSYLKITNKSLHSISSLEKLEVLSMVGCSHIDNDGLRYLNNGRNSLLSIDVSRCDNVTSYGLISVIEGHKSIQKLKSGDCFPDISPVFFSKLSLLKRTLNNLKLDGSQVSASSLKAIGLNCKNLIDISLSKCRGVDDEGISELVKNCTDLRTIDLTCCHLVMDKAMSAIASHCKNLECLRLESCTLLTEKGMDCIGTRCSNLKELDLTDCNMNDAALKFLSRCSKLMVLKLGLCSGISNEGLAHVSSNCRNLRELDLYRCSRINDDGLASLAISCKKLKKLNICYCNEITDKGLKHLSSLKELQDLEMRSLYKVTSLGITAIAMGCISLTELDVKKCYSVDDMAMSALAQYSPNLRQINISYCPITFIGLWKLLGNLRCLQDAKLVHLTRISVEGFELALRASCGRLKKLKLVTAMKNLLPPGLLQMLQARGCRLRCLDKPVTSRLY
ncbi:uncharacterized protein A4U43_C02F21460 [Asparagus officinalis]|uniref:F-box/LRR-repeat protein 15-like leucin rich repeat domain-containing protein n=2 Tax=Asparagus officinalis TaxID=4686 RepID=A0A5P1FKT6_ASPOF|nr:uncharacterized protein A4U43_C02F21460 [Asparagus officinalis]